MEKKLYEALLKKIKEAPARKNPAGNSQKERAKLLSDIRYEILAIRAEADELKQIAMQRLAELRKEHRLAAKQKLMTPTESQIALSIARDQYTKRAREIRADMESKLQHCYERRAEIYASPLIPSNRSRYFKRVNGKWINLGWTL